MWRPQAPAQWLPWAALRNVGLLVLNVTTEPAGAGPVSDIVHAEDVPGNKVELEQFKEASAGAEYPADTVTGPPLIATFRRSGSVAPWGATIKDMAHRHRKRRNPLFRKRWFSDNVIVQSVTWYLRFKLSYRDLAQSLDNSVCPWRRARFCAGSYDIQGTSQSPAHRTKNRSAGCGVQMRPI